MFRFNINMMPFAQFLSTQNVLSYNLNHLFYSAELLEVDAFSFYYDRSNSEVSLDQLRSFIETGSKFLSVYCSIHSDSYMDILDLNPNMIFFCEGLDSNFEFKAVQEDSLDGSITNLIESVNSRSIPCGLVIKSAVKDVKKTSRMHVDYLHFDLSEINSAANIDDELALTESMDMAMIAAEKCGFGVISGGKLNLDNLSLFLKDDRIEEFVSGYTLFEESFLKGFTHSIAQYIRVLKKR